MGNRLEGRVAVITGSSRGIGAAIARLFAAEGIIVAVHGRDKAAVDGVRASIEATGSRAIGVLADVTDFDQIEAMRKEIEKDAGQVDLLIANAGANLSAPGPLEDIPIEAWKATLEANLTATFLTLRSFLPGMKRLGRGDIITIASTAGRRPSTRARLAESQALRRLDTPENLTVFAVGVTECIAIAVSKGRDIDTQTYAISNPHLFAAIITAASQPHLPESSRASPAAPSNVDLISEDGAWRWDGQAWQLVASLPPPG